MAAAGAHARGLVDAAERGDDAEVRRLPKLTTNRRQPANGPDRNGSLGWRAGGGRRRGQEDVRRGGARGWEGEGEGEG